MTKLIKMKHKDGFVGDVPEDEVWAHELGGWEIDEKPVKPKPSKTKTTDGGKK